MPSGNKHNNHQPRTMRRQQRTFHAQVQAGLPVRPAAVGDIAAIFNLIQQCSAEGSFNQAYLQPRFQAGLGLQLFGVLIFGKIRLPNGRWSRTCLQVIERDGAFAGFVIVRDVLASGQRREIYMLAVPAQLRRQGVGRQLLQAALTRIEAGVDVDAQCLPRARQMKQLLHSMGFAMRQPVEPVDFASGTRTFTRSTDQHSVSRRGPTAH